MTKTSADAARRDFGFRLAQIARQWRREMDGEFKRYGLTGATWLPLVHLSRMGDQVRQKDLAFSLGIEGPSLVRLLDTLEGSGLIERRDDETDRRAKTIHLTEKGRVLLEGMSGVVEETRERLLAGLLDDEVVACMRAFDRIERAFRHQKDRSGDRSSEPASSTEG